MINGRTIPAAMWEEMATIDESTSSAIALDLAAHRGRVVALGRRHGFSEQELLEAGLIPQRVERSKKPGDLKGGKSGSR
jgi:hypothetical protein